MLSLARTFGNSIITHSSLGAADAKASTIVTQFLTSHCLTVSTKDFENGRDIQSTNAVGTRKVSTPNLHNRMIFCIGTADCQQCLTSQAREVFAQFASASTLACFCCHYCLYLLLPLASSECRFVERPASQLGPHQSL